MNPGNYRKQYLNVPNVGEFTMSYQMTLMGKKIKTKEKIQEETFISKAKNRPYNPERKIWEYLEKGK
jgi:hypothetical protein